MKEITLQEMIDFCRTSMKDMEEKGQSVMTVKEFHSYFQAIAMTLEEILDRQKFNKNEKEETDLRDSDDGEEDGEVDDSGVSTE